MILFVASDLNFKKNKFIFKKKIGLEVLEILRKIIYNDPKFLEEIKNY